MDGSGTIESIDHDGRVLFVDVIVDFSSYHCDDQHEEPPTSLSIDPDRSRNPWRSCVVVPAPRSNDNLIRMRKRKNDNDHHQQQQQRGHLLVEKEPDRQGEEVILKEEEQVGLGPALGP
jgi:hypothetical protein